MSEDGFTVDHLHGWVSPGGIDSRLYHSPELFEAEMQRIWSRTWVYLAHDSEIPEPGDYVRRQLGTDPVVVVRQDDGSVQVLLNRCAHRGNTVCQADRGTSRAFRCPYHGWTYKTSGRLLGVPYRSGYSDEWFAEGLGLSVARVEAYRGFVFASWNAQAPDLVDHLGAAASRMDRFADASPVGRLRLSAGRHQLRVRANWKMFVENAVDNYHQNFVHQAPLMSHPELKKTSVRVSGDESAALVRDLGKGHTELDFSPEQRAMGRVHKTSATEFEDAAAQAYEQLLTDAYGVAKAKDLLLGGPPHVMIFPNLFLLQQDVRTVVPVNAQESTIVQYPALLEGVPDEINWARLRRHEQAYGPAGSVLPDDIEIFERNQSTLASQTSSRLDLRRGIERGREDGGGMAVSHITDELGQRAIWKHYLSLMS